MSEYFDDHASVRRYTKRTCAVHSEEIKLIVAIEELAELQKALTKRLRGEGNVDDIVEEIADVYLMLEAVKYNLNISEEDIAEVMSYKMERQSERDIQKIVDETTGDLLYANNEKLFDAIDEFTNNLMVLALLNGVNNGQKNEDR